MPFDILIPDETRARLAAYETAVRSGAQVPGQRLEAALAGEDDFLTALLRTKLPQIFAESEVAGDGSDWNFGVGASQTSRSRDSLSSVSSPLAAKDQGRQRVGFQPGP